MRREARLIGAMEHTRRQPAYQEGLQAMWEDRWTLLGGEGAEAWLDRHGQLPPEDYPGLEPTLRLRNVRGLSPGLLKCRVRRTW